MIKSEEYITLNTHIYIDFTPYNRYMGGRIVWKPLGNWGENYALLETPEYTPPNASTQYVQAIQKNKRRKK